LNVMSLLLQRKLEDALGENSPTYKMGIPLLLRSGQRSIESLYLDGFGAVFTVNVNFPLVPPPVNKAKENEDTTGSDDWDRARKELYGVRESRDIVNPYGSARVPYDAEQVGALKAALLEALKNAANIRGLKSDESAIVTVFGSESVEAGRGAAGGPGGGRYAVGRRIWWRGERVEGDDSWRRNVGICRRVHEWPRNCPGRAREEIGYRSVRERENELRPVSAEGGDQCLPRLGHARERFVGRGIVSGGRQHDAGSSDALKFVAADVRRRARPASKSAS